jgi:serine phosphatase RsbU (regulator of sigma subunit)
MPREFRKHFFLLKSILEGILRSHSYFIEIDLFENDMMYLFSDGYVDQFGGVENKKFKYMRFRYLLMNIHRFPVEDQKLILEENIRTWMGNVPQIDDILVMGFGPL